MQIVNVLRVGEYAGDKYIFGATHSWDKLGGYVTIFIQKEDPDSSVWNSNWL
jgi:hypothetical protein